jgi:hypothetical protein
LWRRADQEKATQEPDRVRAVKEFLVTFGSPKVTEKEYK